MAEFVNEITDPECIAHYPSQDADRQVINRIKNKGKPDYPKMPESLSDITLPEFLMYTLDVTS